MKCVLGEAGEILLLLFYVGAIWWYVWWVRGFQSGEKYIICVRACAQM